MSESNISNVQEEFQDFQDLPQVVENSHYSTLNDELYDPQDHKSITPPLRNTKLAPEYDSTDTIPQEHMLSFDKLIHDIDFGNYQIWMFIMISCFGATEGSQITIFTLTIPILQNQWQISSQLTSLQASFVFVGFLIGALASGQFTDRYGRKFPFKISAFMTTFICLVSALSANIYQLLALRGILGIVVGFFAPCSVTMMQEITPAHLRGRFMGIVTISVALGQLYGLLISSFVLESLTDGNWQLLTVWCTVPAILAFIASLVIVEESPRFLLIQGQYDEAFRLIKKMIEQNKSNVDLNDEMKYQLINWAHSMNKVAKNSKNASIASLFSEERCTITSVLWFTWFCLCFNYYGNILLMPYSISQMNEVNQFLGQDPIAQLVISCLSDIAGSLVGAFFVERKGYGRKNSLIIFFLCSSLAAALVYYDNEDRFLLWSTIQKFFLSMGFVFNYQLSAEVYPTKLRATGLGTAIAMGRLGGIIMPWSCMALATRDLLSPFLLFAVLSIMASVGNTFLPYETMGREMDG